MEPLIKPETVRVHFFDGPKNARWAMRLMYEARHGELDEFHDLRDRPTRYMPAHYKMNVKLVENYHFRYDQPWSNRYSWPDMLGRLDAGGEITESIRLGVTYAEHVHAVEHRARRRDQELHYVRCWEAVYGHR